MLIDTIKKENMIALKEKDQDKRAVLSVIINKYMVLGYEAKAKGKELTDLDLIQIINKMIFKVYLKYKLFMIKPEFALKK